MVQENKPSQENQTQQEPQEKPSRYIDMTQEQLSQEITELEQHIKLSEPSPYRFKEIEDLKQTITKQEQYIKEEFVRYKQSIKGFKERINKSREQLKKEMEYLKSEQDYKQFETNRLDIIKGIKEKLAIDPNHYKNKYFGDSRQ